MAVLWLDNFGLYGNVDDRKPSVLLDSGYTSYHYSHFTWYNVNNTGGRTHGQIYEADPYGGNAQLRKYYGYGGDRVTTIVGCAVRLDTLTVSTHFWLGHNNGFSQHTSEIGVGVNLLGQFFVKVRSRGDLGSVDYLRDANGDVITSEADDVRAGGWDYWEMKVVANTNGATNPNGSVVVRVNRREVLNIPNVDTNPRDLNGYNQFNLDMRQPDRYTDLYIADDQGTVNNDFLGDIRVRQIFPTGPGDLTEWTPTGVVDNWDNVNELSPSSSDFNSTLTHGAVDYYHYEDLPTNVTEVFAVGLFFDARKDDAGSGDVVYLCKENGVVHESPRVYMSGSYQKNQYIMDLRPDGTPWDKASLDAAQFGIKAVTG